MADTAVAKTPKKAKSGKVPAPLHPLYKVMIVAALKALNEKSGSSRQAILKYIIANYKVGDEKKAGNRLRFALRKLADSGELKSVKGVGASGSFRLAKDEATAAKKPAAKPKKPVAKKVAPKVAAKKASPKKVAKKPAAVKKSPKKPVVKKAKSPKKPAVKKAAKKPVAKKPAKK